MLMAWDDSWAMKSPRMVPTMPAQVRMEGGMGGAGGRGWVDGVLPWCTW